MKKAVCDFFVFILAFLGTILFGICGIFILPFDYIKYKRSPYYKNERKKYEWFSAQSIHFKIYNEIAKNSLPLRFIPHPTEESVECGWFVLGSTLILPNSFPFDFNPETQIWAFCCDANDDKQEILSLDEMSEIELENYNRLVGEPLCADAVVLIDIDDIENYELAKKEKRFLIYDENRLEVLKQFCENYH